MQALPAIAIYRHRRVTPPTTTTAAAAAAATATATTTTINLASNFTTSTIHTPPQPNQMEHQQHYKMVPRDPSASVPMVIYDGRPGRTMPAARVVTAPTQLIDIFPTIMDYAQVPQAARPADLDGFSLVPMMLPSANAALPHRAHAGDARPNFVTSQFHGCNIAMSWFLVVQADVGADNHTYKRINWGSGAQVPAQLFDLTTDPSEFVNLINDSTAPAIEALRAALDANLRATIDYPTVAQQVHACVHQRGHFAAA
jgi:arylsulfatase A-like enzyme